MKKTVDFFNNLCYNNNCQEGTVGKLQGKVLDNLKKSKKPLDNGLPPCYNIFTIKQKGCAIYEIEL